jgi:4'-phosphopantetheinyl transferase
MTPFEEKAKPPMEACDVRYLDTTAAGDISAALRLLDNDERERALRYRDETAQRSFVFRRALTRSILGRLLDVDPLALAFTRECGFCGHPTHGKPRLLVSHSALSFSASWSGPYVALALALTGEIGIDVELLRGRPPSADLVHAVLGGAHAAVEATGKNTLSERSLLQVWTRKEAVLKCAGLGLTDTAGGLEVTPAHERAAVIHLPPEMKAMAACHLYAVEFDAPLIGHLAADRPVDITVVLESAQFP